MFFFFIVFVSSDVLRMGLNIRYGRVHIDDKVIPWSCWARNYAVDSGGR